MPVLIRFAIVLVIMCVLAWVLNNIFPSGGRTAAKARKQEEEKIIDAVIVEEVFDEDGSTGEKDIPDERKNL